MKQILTILLLTLSTLAFSQETVKHEYVTMSQVFGRLYISTGTDKFEEVKLKDELQHKHHDFTPIQKRIEEFEEEGWEFISGNQSWTGYNPSVPTFTVIMRRKK